MASTLIKVCGITQPEQAMAIAHLGVNAIGMIMHADSPRTVSIDQAREIRKCIPAFTLLVGVFVDASAERINEVSTAVGLNLVQLHGNESSELGSHLHAPYIKAIRARNSQVVKDAIKQHTQAIGFLLDPYHPQLHGGTGLELEPHLWSMDDAVLGARSLILAGGLGPSNLARALTTFAPVAVDLNSGVETEPGNKDLQKVATAISIVRDYDRLQSKKP